MKKIKKPFWIAVLVLCAAAAITGIVLLILSHSASPGITREDVSATPDSATAEQATQTGVDPTGAASSEPATEPLEVRTFGYELEEPKDLNSIDFKELKSINPDIYAWIYLPNTKVDYPVVRGEKEKDDFFYLDHNIYGQYQFAGTIYSELQNKPDMHDPVTVMYGHNMRDGSMFATLHSFEDASFFDKNTTAYVVTEDKIFTYLIYSAYSFDNRHILNSYNFENAESFSKYLDSTLQPRSYRYNVRENVKLTTDSRILTLSTCTESTGTRYLVQGVLVDEQKR